MRMDPRTRCANALGPQAGRPLDRLDLEYIVFNIINHSFIEFTKFTTSTNVPLSQEVGLGPGEEGYARRNRRNTRPAP